MLKPYGLKTGVKFNSIDIYALRANENRTFKQFLNIKKGVPD